MKRPEDFSEQEDTTESPSPRQRAILDFVLSFSQERGFPPSFREIGKAVGIRSTNGVAYQIKALTLLGLLEERSDDGIARSLRLSKRGTEIRPMTRTIPVLGQVPAGRPHSQEEMPGESIEMDARLCPSSGDLLALRVRGESMVDDGILDGDLVIVRKQDEAMDGEVVVALLGGEATVKRLRRTHSGFVLQPANARMKAIWVPPEADFRLVGVVVGLYRSMGA